MNHNSLDLFSIFNQLPHNPEVDDSFHIFDFGNIMNVQYWSEIFDMVKSIEFKSIVEFGVGRGRSLLSIASIEHYRAMKSNRSSSNIYAFDSFQGFPQPGLEDISFRNPKKGEWSTSPSGKYSYSEAFLKTILENASLPTVSNIEFVEGFFNETAKANCERIDDIGILHLDGDLYESTKIPLYYFSDRVVSGGVIVIDDYIIDDPNDAWPGCRRAVEEFISGNKKFNLSRTSKGSPLLIKV